jgi:hypothetical protein
LYLPGPLPVTQRLGGPYVGLCGKFLSRSSVTSKIVLSLVTLLQDHAYKSGLFPHCEQKISLPYNIVQPDTSNACKTTHTRQHKMAPIPSESPNESPPRDIGGLIIGVIMGFILIPLLIFLGTAIWIYLEDRLADAAEPIRIRAWNKERKEGNKIVEKERRMQATMMIYVDDEVRRLGLSEKERKRYYALVR